MLKLCLLMAAILDGGRIQKAPFGTNNAKESSNFNQKLNVKILT
jgi:hypothetical protein